MTRKLSGDEFLENLIDSGLFSEEEVISALKVLPDPPEADGEVVAQRLINAGKLTLFQATAVRERRFEELVIGNYQILDRLGAGGMGTVYKARHRRMKRVVAIKVLAREVAQTEKFVQRFQREVEAVAWLTHPNIVMAYDADEADVGPFLVMEFVNGRDLSSEVQRRGPLPVQEATECLVQAARALDYAHGQGIIHRDIKPANLMRDVNGVVKVADLGLARFSEQFGRTQENTALTQAGSMMGTVDYMPPEQALGLTTIDHRADIYSLGCTFHYLLIGRPPYEGPTMMAILLKHEEAAIPSLSAARGDVPAGLDHIFRRMLAKKPEERFASMAEVVRAVESLPLIPGLPPQPTAATFLEASSVNIITPPTPNRTQAIGPTKATDRTVDLAPARNAGTTATTMLLVEPSRAQSAIIRKYLHEIGFPDVTAAPSGQKALEFARTSPPQLVISAMHLPDMTGVQLVQKMRAEAAPSPPGFILITSQTDAEEANLLSQAGDTVRLPKPFGLDELAQALVKALGSPPPESPTSTSKVRGRLRVLIVDDSASARAHVRSVLTGLGLTQFVEAADGARAVAAVAGETFDLIVTDYNMPFMDGRGLIGYLKQNPSTASIPIIMVTTEEDPAKLESVRQLGVAAVCDKSFQVEAVQKIVDQLVKKP